MSLAMKTTHILHGRRIPEPIDTDVACHPESLPNSSAILAVSVLANVEDVIAVARTAVLIGKSLKAATSIDLMGEPLINIDQSEPLRVAELRSSLEAMKAKLRPHRASPHEPCFAVEASITAASFLAAGTITLHIRSAERSSKSQLLTR